MKTRSVNSRKGRMVEDIAARLYRNTRLKVQTRVRLRPARGTGRPREIDILLTPNHSLGAFDSVRFAVECKNESKPIEAEAIDAFFGKLAYLGIPPENGIFVSRSRFTSGAEERAQDARIRLYRLSGIRDDGLTLEIAEALQSVVYLLLMLDSVTVTTRSADPNAPASDYSPVFVSNENRMVGTIYDPVYRAWIKGEVPGSLGQHTVPVEVPPDWTNLGDSKKEHQVESAQATVRVAAIVFTVKGELRQHLLTRQPTTEIDHAHMQAMWDEHKHPVSLATISTEEALHEHLQSLQGFKVVVRSVRLPRIEVSTVCGRVYWPPSERTLLKLAQGLQTGAYDPSADLEGTAFETIWEEAWSGYPA